MNKNRKLSFLEELVEQLGLTDKAPEFYSQLGLYYQTWGYWKKIENCHRLPLRYEPAMELVAKSYGMSAKKYRELKRKHFVRLGAEYPEYIALQTGDES